MTNSAFQTVPLLLRDQQRALHAYSSVEGVPTEQGQGYKVAVNDLGTNILRGGLCAALAAVQRLEKSIGDLVLDHLAKAKVPGLENATAADLVPRVAKLNVDEYIIATREMLRVAVWLKRAAQATIQGGA